MVRTCLVCGASLANKWKTARFCSKKCQDRDYKRRQNARQSLNAPSACQYSEHVQCRNPGQCHHCSQNPEVEAICTPTHCGDCIHYDAYLSLCDYFQHTGQRRRCPAGKGCTRKQTGRKKKAKDKEREQAYLLWQQGLHNAEIARRVGVSEATVGIWRRKIWEVRAWT